MLGRAAPRPASQLHRRECGAAYAAGSCSVLGRAALRPASQLHRRECGVAYAAGSCSVLGRAAPAPRRSPAAASTAPATHSTPVTSAAVCTPLTNAWPLPSVTAARRGVGMSPEVGEMPIATASLALPRPCATGPGTPAEVSSPVSVAPTRLLIRETSTEVPSAPPTWSAVAWRPPATPASSTGALPTIASEEAAITMPTPRPSAMNGGHIAAYEEWTPQPSTPKEAAAWSTMPSGIDSRAPNRSVSAAPSGEATTEARLSGRVRTPASTGV